jgi:hypothetical protein
LPNSKNEIKQEKYPNTYDKVLIRLCFKELIYNQQNASASIENWA